MQKVAVMKIVSFVRARSLNLQFSLGIYSVPASGNFYCTPAGATTTTEPDIRGKDCRSDLDLNIDVRDNWSVRQRYG